MDKNEALKTSTTAPAAPVAEVKLPEALPRHQKIHTNLRAGMAQSARY